MKLALGLVGLALALAGAGCTVLDKPETPTPEIATPTPRPTATPIVQVSIGKTAQVTRADLLSQIKMRGRLVAVNESTLSFRRDGLLRSVLIKAGDRVEKGQVIAELDETALLAEIEGASADLESAKGDLELARLGTVENGTVLAELAIRTAGAGVEAAKAKLEKVRAGATEQEKRAAELSIERAKLSLWSAQSSRDSVCGSAYASKGSCDGANASVALAELSVTQAREDLERLKAGPKTDDVAAAEAQVRLAELGVQSARVQYDQESQRIKSASQQRVITLRIKESLVRQRESDLKKIQNRATEYKLVAAFTGSIASVQAQIGDKVTAYQSLGVLVNPTEIEIEAGIAMSDISWISTGQEAEFVVDGFPNDRYRAKVKTIAQQPTSGTDQRVYLVRLSLADGAKTPTIVPAGCDVVFGIKRVQALLIPIGAVIRVDDRAYVEVPADSGARRVPVTLGLSSYSDVEVLGGLAESDTVLVKTATSK